MAQTYPDAPWSMHGQLWLSLFRVRPGDHPDRTAGVHGVALVSYEDPSPLTYGELLVARPVRREDGRRVNITDIWVDSVPSRDGGRALWAIPKDLAEFRFDTTSTGTRAHTSCAVTVDGVPTATARFTDVSGLAPRVPFRGSTWQEREDGSSVVAPLRGRARSLPARATWSFDAEGPLAWLAGKRPLASFRMKDFSMSFG